MADKITFENDSEIELWSAVYAAVAAGRDSDPGAIRPKAAVAADGAVRALRQRYPTS